MQRRIGLSIWEIKGMTNHREYLQKLIQCLEQMTLQGRDGKKAPSYEEGVALLVEVFTRVKRNGGQVFFIGNGGSAAIASHMTADFMKNGGMRTYSLYDNSVTTCMGNDYGYEFIFSRPLELLIKENDLLVAISSSGNSMSIVNAVAVAKEKGAEVITLSGFKQDNKIRQMGDYNLHVGIEHYGIVESVHNLVLQQVVDDILERDGICL